MNRGVQSQHSSPNGEAHEVARPHGFRAARTDAWHCRRLRSACFWP